MWPPLEQAHQAGQRDGRGQERGGQPAAAVGVRDHRGGSNDARSPRQQRQLVGGAGDCHLGHHAIGARIDHGDVAAIVGRDV